MIFFFSIALLIGLIKASQYYSQTICASIWSAGHFVVGLLAGKRFFANLFVSIGAFAMSWMIFKLLRESDEISIRWLAIAGIGGFLLLCF